MRGDRPCLVRDLQVPRCPQRGCADSAKCSHSARSSRTEPRGWQLQILLSSLTRPPRPRPLRVPHEGQHASPEQGLAPTAPRSPLVPGGQPVPSHPPGAGKGRLSRSQATIPEASPKFPPRCSPKPRLCSYLAIPRAGGRERALLGSDCIPGWGQGRRHPAWNGVPAPTACPPLPDPTDPTALWPPGPPVCAPCTSLCPSAGLGEGPSPMPRAPMRPGWGHRAAGPPPSGMAGCWPP